MANILLKILKLIISHIKLSLGKLNLCITIYVIFLNISIIKGSL